MYKVEVSHLLVSNFWIESNHLWVIEHLNETKSVTNCWKEDISTWLIWLWFDCKLNVITIVDYILPKDVEAFCITLAGTVSIL